MAKKPIEVDALKHAEAKRKNIPTAEFESVMREEDKTPLRLAYERRNRDLDPQIVWRGKDRAGLVRSRRPGAAALYPGEGSPQGDHRRSAAPVERARKREGGATRRPVRRFQRASRPGSGRLSFISTTSTGRTG